MIYRFLWTFNSQLYLAVECTTLVFLIRGLDAQSLPRYLAPFRQTVGSKVK